MLTHKQLRAQALKRPEVTAGRRSRSRSRNSRFSMSFSGHARSKVLPRQRWRNGSALLSLLSREWNLAEGSTRLPSQLCRSTPRRLVASWRCAWSVNMPGRET